MCPPPRGRYAGRRLRLFQVLDLFGWQASTLCPEAPSKSPVQTLPSDLRYTFRSLFRAPSFALAVVAVLALGIGANTAIFSIVNAVLLRPLPFEEPDRLVRLFHVPPQSTFPGMRRFSVSAANFYDWKRDARLFEKMAVYRFGFFTMTGNGEARAITAGAVEPDFFDVVRARPAAGRVFLPEEDTPGHSHVVILSYGFWKSRFGGAPDAIGRTLTLDGEAYTIVGVMPAISARLEREYPKENAGWGATVVPLQELIVGDVRMSLVMLVAAVALVLL